MRYILLLLFLNTFFAQAQNKVWGEKGATWRYDYIQLIGPDILEVKKNRDTVINGKNCEIYRTTLYNFFEMPPPSYEMRFGNTSIHEEHITYLSGDTVFFFHSGSFHILYNFAAKIGDTWNLGLTHINAWNCYESIVQVSDTGSEYINNVKLRYIQLEMVNDTTIYTVAGKVYERLGPDSMSGYLFPVLNGLCFSTSCLSYERLKCYKDDTFPLYITSTNWGGLFVEESCDINFYLGLEKNQNNLNIDIFPNPFKESISINIPKSAGLVQFELISIYGQVCKTGIVKEIQNEISTSNLPNGSYYLRLIDQKGNVQIDKLIKN